MTDQKKINRAIIELQKKDGEGIFGKSPAELAVAMRDRSEREFLILLGTVLDERLKERIDQYFEKVSPTRGAMTEGSGAAKTLSQRLELAEKFKLIDKRTRKLAELIAEMRNYAAHHLGPVDFETPVIGSAAKVLLAPFDWPDSSYLRRLRMIARTFFIGIFPHEHGQYESLDWED